MLRTIIICCLVLCLATASAMAQVNLPQDPIAAEQTAAAETALFQDIPSVFESATYEQKTTEAPSALTIITAEQIKKYGHRQLAHIFESMPGLLGHQGARETVNYNSSRVRLTIGNRSLSYKDFDKGYQAVCVIFLQEIISSPKEAA
jgi:hypothetical protein